MTLAHLWCVLTRGHVLTLKWGQGQVYHACAFCGYRRAGWNQDGLKPPRPFVERRQKLRAVGGRKQA